MLPVEPRVTNGQQCCFLHGVRTFSTKLETGVVPRKYGVRSGTIVRVNISIPQHEVSSDLSIS